MSVNLASSELWVATAPNSNKPAPAKYGGAFAVNGDGNSIQLRTDPWGTPALVWVSANNDLANDADGGWIKAIDGIDPTRKHLSVVYFRRVSDSAAGRFYHGCSNAGATENLASGTTNTNPYFVYLLLSALAIGVWYVSVGIIHEAGYVGGYSGVSGIYRVTDGAKIANSLEYRQKAGNTTQAHRTYLFYSTNPLDEVEWWNPGFYPMDGTEPTLPVLCSKPPAKNVAWSEAWEEAVATADTGEFYIDTLEISNDALTTPIRVCNSFEPLIVAAMRFEPFYFDLSLPEMTAGSLPQMKVGIGNFSAELRAALRLIKTSSGGTTVKYRQYRVVNDVPVLGDYMDLPMPVASIDIPSGDGMISITCEPTNIVNLPLHRKFYTISRFPGLKV